MKHKKRKCCINAWSCYLMTMQLLELDLVSINTIWLHRSCIILNKVDDRRHISLPWESNCTQMHNKKTTSQCRKNCGLRVLFFLMRNILFHITPTLISMKTVLRKKKIKWSSSCCIYPCFLKVNEFESHWVLIPIVSDQPFLTIIE